MVKRFRRVGRKVAFAGFKVSGGITAGLSYSACLEVGTCLECRLVQRRSLVPEP